MNIKTDGFRERRRYVRLLVPVTVEYFSPDGTKVSKTTAKNISADGLRFETTDKSLKESDRLEVKLGIEGAANPIHATAEIVWKKKLSLEDKSPFDVGLEFTGIEEDNKNTFLKNMCDMIYRISETTARKRSKKCSA